MAILPPNTQMSIVQTASSISAGLTIEEYTNSFTTYEFERKEYSNDFLLNLPNDDGSLPILQKNIVGKWVQTQFVNCGTSTARDPLPDNPANILKRFSIKTINIKGGPSSPSAVDAISVLAADHARRYSTFQGHFKSYGVKASYQFFYNLRNDLFTYLTQSGVSISAFAGANSISESNVFIRSYSPGFQYRNPRTNIVIVKDFSIQCEVYGIEESQMVY